MQWYSRIEQLPKPLRALSVDPPLNETWELVHEGQRYKGDLSIETIFGKCEVLICNVNEVPKSIIGKQKKSCIFFCRFALGPKNSRSFISVNEAGITQMANLASKTNSGVKSVNNNNNNEEVTTPARKTLKPRRLSGAEEIDSVGPAELATTPRSSKRVRHPPRYLEETLPSPLKNATFSVSSTKTKDLCIVIQRCDSSAKKELTTTETEPVKVRARKKLDLDGNTPTKVSKRFYV